MTAVHIETVTSALFTEYSQLRVATLNAAVHTDFQQQMEFQKDFQMLLEICRNSSIQGTLSREYSVNRALVTGPLTGC